VGPHEQTLLLLRKAAEDEALVDEVLSSARVTNSIVGFHLQQAAEKLLKAMLSELGVGFRRTHDLRELMEKLADAGHPLPDHLADLDTLNPYASLFRYDSPGPQEALDRKALREMVRSLRVWVEATIGGADA